MNLPSGAVLFAAFFAIVIIVGCVTNGPSGEDRNVVSDQNLSVDDLADMYLAQAATITDYRLIYGQSMIEWKKPNRIRVGSVDGPAASNSFGISNGTVTAWYEAGLYYFQANDAYRSADYQSMVQETVANRNFTIVDISSTPDAPTQYLIEEGNFTTSGTRAWIEPSTGLAWEILNYMNCSLVPDPVEYPCSWSGQPIGGIRFDRIEVNTGIPDSHFDFVPPNGSRSECYPNFIRYVKPRVNDTSVPIDQPFPGGVDYSLTKHDSAKPIIVRQGEVIEITLELVPAPGYHWIMTNEVPENSSPALELLNAGKFDTLMEDGDDSRSVRYYRWRYRAVSPGTETLDGSLILRGCQVHGGGRFLLRVDVVA